MSRKQPKRTAGKVAYSALAGFFVLVVVACGIGFSVASADSTNSADDFAQFGAFGYDEATTSATITPDSSEDGTLAPQGADPEGEPAADDLAVLAAQSDAEAVAEAADEPSTGIAAESEPTVLERTTVRDLSNGYQMIDAMEQAERERIERENTAIFARISATKAENDVFTNTSPLASENTAETEYGLPAVDWTVGMVAFVDEWAERIDAYLEGSELEGYGRTFAQAAWDYGVDPRFSPGISCVESGKGAVCFRTCNAWGWGGINWPDWETAINAHVKGLADGYGYSVTREGATSYNYETPAAWYDRVLEEMAKI